MSHEEDLTTSSVPTTFIIFLFGIAVISILFYFASTSNPASSTAATTTIAQTLPTPNSTLADGLVGHWTFDGPTISSTTVVDQSGNGNNGTLTGGPTPVAGLVGQGRGFNGSSQYVSVSNSASLNPSYLTLSAWVKVNSLGTYSIIRKGYVSPSLEYFLRTESTGKITGSVVNASLSQVQFSSNGVILAGQWQFVTVTYDGSYIKIYINGIFDSQSAQTGILNSSTGVVGIGYRPTGNDQFLNGFLDDTRIYSRALSADEIYQLYHLGKPDVMNAPADPVPSLGQGLVGYWKFDEGTGSTTVDSTGRGMTGTLTGNPTWTGGQINSAVNLDGTGDYVSIADNAALDVGTGDFTYSFWLNPDVINQGVFFSDGSYTDGIMFYRYTDNYTYLWLANTYIQTTAWAPTASVWQHVVVRRTSGTVTIFADGVLKYTTASLPGSIDSSSGMRIGYGFAGAANLVLDGKIDEFRMYNRALSDAEILELTRLNVPTDFDSSLVGYWSFNGKDISGTTAYDRSGKGNNGTLTNGPKAATGKIGQGMSLDGSNDYVQIADNDVFSPSGDFSVSQWVRAGSLQTGSGNRGWITTKGIAGQYEWAVYTVGDGTNAKFKAVLWNTTNNPWRDTTGITNVIAGDWYHVVMTFNQTTDEIKIYVNGISEGAQSPLAGTQEPNGTAPMRIGARGDNVSYTFDGTIDDVRIYNRLLSAEEVTDLYTRSKGVTIDAAPF